MKVEVQFVPASMLSLEKVDDGALPLKRGYSLELLQPARLQYRYTVHSRRPTPDVLSSPGSLLPLTLARWTQTRGNLELGSVFEGVSGGAALCQN